MTKDGLYMLGIFKSLSPGSGFSPSVLWGIWAHETEIGKSPLWTGSLNPGGIKFRSGFFITSCFSMAPNKRDAKYPNREIAAAALVFFLRQARYSAGRDAADDLSIVAIGKAGYVEHVSGEPANWISGVTKFAAEARRAS